MTEQEAKITLDGDFESAVAVGGGEAVDARDSQGMVYKPSAPVTQNIYNSSVAAVGAALKTFLLRHWPVLLLLMLVNGTLWFVSPILQARYLISPLIVFVVLVLATLTILGWYGVIKQIWRGDKLWRGAAGVSILLGAVLGWQVKGVIWPRRFDPQEFGVAVAYFGEGPDFVLSQRSKQLSYDLIERLTSEAQRRDMLARIGIQQIGVISSSAEGKRAGERIGASLVIWGRFIVGEEGAVTVHFEVVEPPASALNPDTPRVLPIGYTYSAAATDYTADIQGIHHFEIREAIAEQSNAVTFFVLGLALHLDHQDQAAIPLFQQTNEVLAKRNVASADANVTDMGVVHYYLGRSYQRLGYFEKAVLELESAVQINTRDPAARLVLAYCYRSLGRLQDAERLFREAVALCRDILVSDSKNKEALYDLGLAYLMLEEEDNALDVYLRLIEIHPDFYIAYVGAGVIYAQQKNFDAAIDIYTQGIQQAEQAGYNGADARVGLGDVYLKQGEMDAALAAYRLAAQLEPERDWMHFRLAQCYEERGDVDLAWEAYQRLIEVSDNQIWAYSVMGDFLSGQKLYDLAIQNYDRARRLNPDNATVYLRLGEIYLEKYSSPEGQPQDAQQAEQAFGIALDRMPEHLQLQFYVFAARGRLYFTQQRFDLAAEDFKSALELNLSSPEILFSLARTYEVLDDIPNACNAYRAVLAPEIQATEPLQLDTWQKIRTLCQD